MNILITDDHPVVRSGLIEILRKAFPDSLCVEAANGQEMLSRLADSRFDLLVFDINLVGRGGLCLLPEVKTLYPKLPVIIFSVQPADGYATRCLRLGATAYICKDSGPEELLLAIREVVDGGRSLSPPVAGALIVTLGKSPDPARHKALSAREGEVLQLISEGIPLKEIADRLRVSTKTISSYRTRMMQKMELKSNAQLIRYALANHLVR